MRPSTNLARIQSDFQQFLLRGSDAIHAHVVGTERVPPGVRLAIYSNAYVSRLTESLETNYPGVAKLLGERDFNELAAEYIAAHDSSFFSIRCYGHALAHFVASNARYRPVPFLADLARWEWTLNEVFDSADAEPLAAEALAHKAPGEWASMRFAFHPSMRTLALHWNAPQVWKALMNQSARPRAALSRTPITWLLWRHELKELFRPLSAAEGHALAAARAGENFGDICTGICNHVPEQEAPARAAEFLRNWIEGGLITGLS